MRHLPMALALAAGVALGGFGVYKLMQSDRDGGVKRLVPDEVIVFRTPGGMLEVSTLVKNEEFGWKTSHTCPFIPCDGLIQPTVTNVRLPVHYTYRIPLSETWTLKPKDGHYELTVPREQPKLPVAADFSKMDIRTEKGWLSPSVTGNREELLKHIGPELNQRAGQSHYIDMQRKESQKTVEEFARKWMLEQGVGKGRPNLPITVVFDDKSPTNPQ